MKPNKVNEINTTRVLRKIWQSDGISRADLSREIGLVKSTVTRIVSTLINQGIVKEVQETISATGIGRKPLGLKINSDYGYILGLEIQTDFYHANALNLRGEVIFSQSGSLPASKNTPVETFGKVMGLLEDGLEQIPCKLKGIGVALAGIIDHDKGVILQSNPFNIFEPIRFLDEIKAFTDVPVILSNDANCCCWGELVDRKHTYQQDFLYILGEFRTGETKQVSDYWGLAVGVGFVLNGKVHRGSTGSAGEFQSILWTPGHGGQFSIPDIEAKTIKTDKAVMERVFRELSSHAALLVNILNFSHIIIGGEISEYRDLLEKILTEEIQKNWSYPSRVECAIDFSSMGSYAAAYGAAGMLLEKVFSIPEIPPGKEEKQDDSFSDFGLVLFPDQE